MPASARRDWQPATAVMFREETSSVRSVVFNVPGRTGHLAGQHVDIRLTAENGNQAQRSNSIASPAGDDTRNELTNERAPLMLIGGGSGVVPMMSMLSTRYKAGAAVPARRLYSSRTVHDIIYR